MYASDDTIDLTAVRDSPLRAFLTARSFVIRSSVARSVLHPGIHSATLGFIAASRVMAHTT